MGKTQLNQKVLQYQRTGKEDVFLDVYKQIRKQIDPFMNATAKQLDTDPNEILSIVHETILRTVNQYTGEHDFENFFNRSYKNAQRDFIRKKQFRERYEYLSADVLYERNKLYTGSPVEAESNQALAAEQRQILSYLIEKAEDLTTKAIVNAFPQYRSITALGKALGLHHETVKRKLRSLSFLYDEKKFGNIHDYFSETK